MCSGASSMFVWGSGGLGSGASGIYSDFCGGGSFKCMPPQPPSSPPSCDGDEGEGDSGQWQGEGSGDALLYCGGEFCGASVGSGHASERLGGEGGGG